MSFQFTVLASGSGGNASLLQINGFGLLLDAGLGPRQLAERLTAVEASWSHIHAALLTHTHADHWKDRTLAQLCRRRIPLYCHAAHQDLLQTYGQAFPTLRAANLVRHYQAQEEFSPLPGLRCRPLPLRHDCSATFGFRFDVDGLANGQKYALAYAADLGSWTGELAEQLANVDLLALEFNHDVELEHASGRSPYLIARVLSDDGHLSNVQAGALLAEVLKRSQPGRLRHVVQLHLSRDCNHPCLAAEVAQQVLSSPSWPIQLHTASQFEPGPRLHLSAGSNGNTLAARSGSKPRSTPSGRHQGLKQPLLPGMGD
jgi:phosphoribosyl 1,2-cyclic phosphodiesterase